MKESSQTFFWRSYFSVKNRGARTVLEEPQIEASPKWLWLLWRSHLREVVTNTIYRGGLESRAELLENIHGKQLRTIPSIFCSVF
jgi:hypothetical protein